MTYHLLLLPIGIVLGFALRQAIYELTRRNQWLDWIEEKKAYFDDVRHQAFQDGREFERGLVDDPLAK